MQVKFLNASGTGFDVIREVPDGTTVGQLIQSTLPGGEVPTGYKIRLRRAGVVHGGVGGEPLTADFVLLDGDRVSCVAHKTEAGAIFRRLAMPVWDC